METMISIVVGVLVSAGVYLMLSPNFIRFIFGLILVSNATNLIIFVAGGLSWAQPALVRPGFHAPSEGVSNALPQALILTAIVISFGLVAFTLVLAFRVHQELGTVNTDLMRVAEPRTDPSGKSAGETGSSMQ